jgi:hypothetical protein
MEMRFLVIMPTAYPGRLGPFIVRKQSRFVATAIANAPTVSMPAIFISGGIPNKRKNNSYAVDDVLS